MKISIRNHSNKRRSKKAMEELKQFALETAFSLGIVLDIKEIRLHYKANWGGYYPKGKPLGGFFKLYKNKVVTINFTGHWDYCQVSRKEAILHELTHVQQMIEKRLKVHSKGTTLKWEGIRRDSWRKYRESTREALKTRKERRAYKGALIPWDLEVWDNIDRYHKMGLI